VRVPDADHRRHGGDADERGESPPSVHAAPGALPDRMIDGTAGRPEGRAPILSDQEGDIRMAVVVIATWTAKPGREHVVREAIEQLAPASRAEQGNLLYQPFADPGAPSIFKFFEVYRDEAALAAHTGSEHFQRLALGTAVQELESRVRETYRTIDV
jgi:quinol monooxygenase YgiN